MDLGWAQVASAAADYGSFKDLITYYIFMKANKLQNLQGFMKLQSLDEETTSYNTPWAHVECVWWCLMFAGRWKDQRTLTAELRCER